MDTFEILEALGASIVTNVAQRRESDGTYTRLGEVVGGRMVLNETATRLFEALSDPEPEVIPEPQPVMPKKRGRPPKATPGLDELLDALDP